MISDSEGDDTVIIWSAKEKQMKKLPRNRNITINDVIIARLKNAYSEKNIKVREKNIENTL